MKQIGQKEVEMRQMVFRETGKFQSLVVEEMMREWDRVGSGSFPVYLIQNYERYWMGRVRKN